MSIIDLNVGPPIGSTLRPLRGRLGAVALIMIAPLLTGCGLISLDIEGRGERIVEYEDAALPPATLGQRRFIFDDMGGLSTKTLNRFAVPWKLTATALVLDAAAREGGPVRRAAIAPLLQSYGFIIPDTIANWRGPGPAPTFELPIGLITGTLEIGFPAFELEVANIGCAACHGGVLYDRDGEPQRAVWAGLPNSSLNLEGYVQAVYRALKLAMVQPDEQLATMARLFPEMSATELETYRDHIVPRVARRLAALTADNDRPLPFDNGASGLTNGVASLKAQLELLHGEALDRDFGFTSIPDIGGTMLRSSLLVDGFYAPHGAPRQRPRWLDRVDAGQRDRLARIVAFFTVPAFGISPETAAAAMGRVRDVIDFVADYRPPPFPAPIDLDRAARGRRVYAAHCAGCHGDYANGPGGLELVQFPNRLVDLAEIGSDAARVRAATPTIATAIARTPFGPHIDARSGSGYVATPLTGLWASAPYLHNGSVPTLWHLMHPAERPRAFEVGGHRLDFARVGIAGADGADGVMRHPADHRPWARPTLYDTTTTGRGNGGHTAEFIGLSEAEKTDLIEFLKDL